MNPKEWKEDCILHAPRDGSTFLHEAKMIASASSAHRTVAFRYLTNRYVEHPVDLGGPVIGPRTVRTLEGGKTACAKWEDVIRPTTAWYRTQTDCERINEVRAINRTLPLSLTSVMLVTELGNIVHPTHGRGGGDTCANPQRSADT